LADTELRTTFRPGISPVDDHDAEQIARQLVKIYKAARECTLEERSEESWCEDVYAKIVENALCYCQLENDVRKMVM